MHVTAGKSLTHTSADIQVHSRDTQEDHGERLHMHIPSRFKNYVMRSLDMKPLLTV